MAGKFKKQDTIRLLLFLGATRTATLWGGERSCGAKSFYVDVWALLEGKANQRPLPAAQGRLPRGRLQPCPPSFSTEARTGLGVYICLSTSGLFSTHIRQVLQPSG
jgi:hypothetical protein